MDIRVIPIVKNRIGPGSDAVLTATRGHIPLPQSLIGRKFLTAKIASGEWDGIIVTHSSFERIGMSRDYQEKFLLAQIAEYDELLREHAGEKGAGRNLIKTIEKQKAAGRAERLKELLAEDRKNDGLVFDELGVDHVFIDEAQ